VPAAARSRPDAPYSLRRTTEHPAGPHARRALPPSPARAPARRRSTAARGRSAQTGGRRRSHSPVGLVDRDGARTLSRRRRSGVSQLKVEILPSSLEAPRRASRSSAAMRGPLPEVMRRRRVGCCNESETSSRALARLLAEPALRQELSPARSARVTSGNGRTGRLTSGVPRAHRRAHGRRLPRGGVVGARASRPSSRRSTARSSWAVRAGGARARRSATSRWSSSRAPRGNGGRSPRSPTRAYRSRAAAARRPGRGLRDEARAGRCVGRVSDDDDAWLRKSHASRGGRASGGRSPNVGCRFVREPARRTRSGRAGTPGVGPLCEGYSVEPHVIRRGHNAGRG